MATLSFKLDKLFVLLVPELIKFRHWLFFGADVDGGAADTTKPQTIIKYMSKKRLWYH
jgi:hypothetical protein